MHSVKAIPIPHQNSMSPPGRSSSTRARGHSISQSTANTSTMAAGPSSHQVASQQHSQSQATTPSTTSPSKSLSSSAVIASGSSSSSSSERDINIKDFFPEGDTALLKFMDEASIIKAQREALEALNDAALARALRESQEMAAVEEKKRKGKERERDVEEEEKKEENESSAESGAAITVNEESVPDTVTREDSPPLSSLSSSVKEMTVPPPPLPVMLERYPTDEAAARLLAREWKVASLQRALLQNPDMIPASNIPVSASSSTSSSTSSAATISSSSASASAAARRTAASPSRAMPMTIPAEAFYSRSGHHKRGSSSSSSSTVSSRPSTATATSPPSSASSSTKISSSSPPSSSSVPHIAAPATPTKDKHHPQRMYTSASSAAAAQAQAHAQAQAQAQQAQSSTTAAVTKTSSTSSTEKTRSVPTTPSKSTSTSTSTASLNSTRVQTTSRHHVPAESPKKSVLSASPERPRTTPSAATVVPVPTTKAHTSASSSAMTTVKVSPPVPPKAHTLSAIKMTGKVKTTTTATVTTSSAVSSVAAPNPAVCGINSTANATSTSVKGSANVNVKPAPTTTLPPATPLTPPTTPTAPLAPVATSASEKSWSTSAPGSVTSSPGISPATSITSASSVASAAGGGVTVTSASKVAAEKEKEKALAMASTGVQSPPVTSSASAAAMQLEREREKEARKERERIRERSEPSSLSSSITSLPSPLLRTTFGLDHIITQQKAGSPRDADELFSVPPTPGGANAGEKVEVVPVSSLSESDDEDEDGEEDEDEDADVSSEDDDEEEGVEDVEGEESDDENRVEVEDPVSFIDLYTANRSCSKCSESILYSSISQKSTSASLPSLHVSCPRCSTLHCRGCTTSSTRRCSKACSGNGSTENTCGLIKDCCPQIRAIAVFEALSAFDEAYLTELDLHKKARGLKKIGRGERAEFVRDLVSKRIESQAKRMEGVLMQCMNVLVGVFKAHSSSSSRSSSRSKRRARNLIRHHPQLESSILVTHIEHSFMPEVIQFYLANTNARDWITHADMYTVILNLLRYMFEAGYGEEVMDIRLKKIEKSLGLCEWLLRGDDDNDKKKKETVVWVLAEAEKREEEKKTKGGEMSRGLLRGGAEKLSIDIPSPIVNKNICIVQDEVEMRKEGEGGEYIAATMEPLSSLIMGLETHRASLLEMVERVTFMPTVVKLNVLCDGISQLVLGQVLGI